MHQFISTRNVAHKLIGIHHCPISQHWHQVSIKAALLLHTLTFFCLYEVSGVSGQMFSSVCFFSCHHTKLPAPPISLNTFIEPLVWLGTLLSDVFMNNRANAFTNYVAIKLYCLYSSQGSNKNDSSLVGILINHRFWNSFSCHFNETEHSLYKENNG